jgi:hypothetical protein
MVVDARPDQLAGFLVRLVVISGLVVAVLGFRLRVRHRPSPLGRAMVARLGRDHESRAEGAALAGVAAFGFRAIHDDDLRWALLRSAGGGD